MGTADSGFGSHATAGSMISIQRQQERMRDLEFRIEELRERIRKGQQERIRDARISNKSMIYQVYISVYYIIFTWVLSSLVVKLSTVCCHSCIF